MDSLAGLDGSSHLCPVSANSISQFRKNGAHKTDWEVQIHQTRQQESVPLVEGPDT